MFYSGYWATDSGVPLIRFRHYFATVNGRGVWGGIINAGEATYFPYKLIILRLHKMGEPVLRGDMLTRVLPQRFVWSKRENVYMYALAHLFMYESPLW